jgi:tetrahedral aminopeptidase
MKTEGDTMDLKELLFGLTDTDGVSGAEENAGEFALARLRSYTDDAYIDSFGSVVGRIGKHSPDKPTLLLDAHIDEIGMIVTFIDEKGFVKVGNCGGLDRRLLLAQQVLIHGRQPVPGVICSKPPHLLTDEEKKKAPEVTDIAIDTGFSKAQLEERISLGDRITFHAVNRELLNGRVSGKSFDDRSGVAAILMALDLL